MNSSRLEKWVNAAFFVTFVVVCFAGGVITRGLSDRAAQSQIEKMVVLAACEYELDNIRVIDGDTVEADILFPLGLTLRGEYIRFSDYDAWESSKRRRSVTVTDAEVIKGKQATTLLTELLQDRVVVLMLAEGERDPYGRILGRAAVYTDTGTRLDVKEVMQDLNMLRGDNDKKEKGINEY